MLKNILKIFFPRYGSQVDAEVVFHRAAAQGRNHATFLNCVLRLCTLNYLKWENGVITRTRQTGSRNLKE